MITHWHPLLDDAKQPTRRRILVALKVLGEATAKTLSEQLNLTPMGVRRHLNALEADGLAAYRVVRHGQGRPRYVYYLTPKALALFDQRYASLGVELLRYIAEEQGEGAVSHLFRRRAERRIAEAMPRLDAHPLERKVAILAEILDKDGYLAEWRREGEDTFLICEHHCAIQEVAQAFPQACESELLFIRSVLPEAEVERVRHIVSGHHCCSYRIRKKGGEEAQ